ncbi:MAG: cell division protein FtsA [Rhodomicrobium sp.]|nr:MAG: cell division protein FtsA [Rhodomicrobium sp.]
MFGREKNSKKLGSRVTVLDLGTSKFTCLIGEWVDPDALTSGQPIGAMLRIIGFGQQRARGMKAGVLVDLDAAESAVRDVVSQAEKMAGVEVGDVVVAVTCGRLHSMNFTTTVDLNGGSVRASHIEEVMLAGRDHAADNGRAVLHLVPLGYTLDEASGVIDPTNLVGDRLELDLHAVTADVSPLKNIALLLDNCHLRASRMMASSYVSALATADVSEMELGTTVIDIGGGTTKLALFANGYFVHSDAIAIGGDLISFEIAQALNCPMQEAERIKVLYGSVFGRPGELEGREHNRPISYTIVGEGSVGEGQISPQQLADIIRPRAQHILSLVMQRLQKSGFGAHSGQRLILTGGGSQLTGLAEFASEIFGKPVRVGSPQALEGMPPEMLGPAFASSVGLYEALLSYDLADDRTFKVAKTPRDGGYFSNIGNWLKESF